MIQASHQALQISAPWDIFLDAAIQHSFMWFGCTCKERPHGA